MTGRQALNDFLQNNPENITGLSAMTDAEVLTELQQTETYERKQVSGAEIYNAIDPTEFAGLSSAQQSRVRDVFSLGDRIDVSQGTNARAVLLNAFPGGGTTVSNLQEVVQETRTIAQKYGIGDGVTERDIAYVRAW